MPPNFKEWKRPLSSIDDALNEIACWTGDEIAAGREVGDEKIFLMKVLSRGILGICGLLLRGNNRYAHSFTDNCSKSK